MKRSVFLFVLLASAAAAQGAGPRGRGRMQEAGPGVRLLGAEAGFPGPLVTGAPYSADAVTDITQSLPDGNKIHRTTTTRIYRDSQGRTRREPALNLLGSATPGASVPQLAFINDPVAGVNHVLDLVKHTANTTTTSRPPGSNRPRRQPSNGKTESLGRQVIAGVPADGTRTTVTIAAGQIGNVQPIQIVTETWYSPDLQLTVLSKRSDPRSGESVFQLTNLSRAEPPATLFAIPGDFQVQPVSGRPRRGAPR